MYQVYLVTKEDIILFPLAPSYILIKIKNKDKTIDLANFGEVNILKSVGLTNIKLDLRLFSEELPYLNYPNGFKPPGWFIDKLIKLKTNKQYARLVIIRDDDSFDTNMLVSIRDIVIPEETEKGSGYFDIELDLDKYIDTETDYLELKDIGGKKALVRNERKRPSKSPKSSVVVKDRSLWEIAKNELNDENKVKEIIDLNGLKSVNDIKPGEVLKLQ